MLVAAFLPELIVFTWTPFPPPNIHYPILLVSFPLLSSPLPSPPYPYSIMDSVKSFVMGSAEEPQRSTQIQENFLRHALKDESTGELYMTENEFINAIVPKHEDYVSVCVCVCVGGAQRPKQVLFFH